MRLLGGLPAVAPHLREERRRLLFAELGDLLEEQLLNHDGDLLDGERVESVLEVESDAEALADLSDDLRREDRIPAEFKEIVMHADALDAEGPLPDPGDNGLDLGARSDVVVRERRTWMEPMRRVAVLERLQILA